MLESCKESNEVKLPVRAECLILEFFQVQLNRGLTIKFTFHTISLLEVCYLNN